MTLSTPAKIRTLQRKLYCKAKSEPSFRFYALYDKIYRSDILSHAYHFVCSNKGVPGIDGVSIESIEDGEGEGYGARRMPYDEGHRKAVYGKTVRTV